VNGVDTLTNKIFIIRCRNVVLACGKNKQRRLEVIKNYFVLFFKGNSEGGRTLRPMYQQFEFPSISVLLIIGPRLVKSLTYSDT